MTPKAYARPTVVYHHRTQGTDAQGIHVQEMCRAFEAIGYRVVKVSPYAVEGVGKDSRPGLLARLLPRLPRLVYELLELGYNLAAVPRLYRAVAASRPAFIYERYSLFNVGGAVVSKLTGVPLALEVNAPLAIERARHGGLVLAGLARRLEAAVGNAAERVVAVSGVLARMLVQGGVDPGRIAVMHNGVNTDDFPDLEGLTDQSGQAGPGPDKDPAGDDISGFLDAEEFPEAKAMNPGTEGATVLGFTGWFRPWHGLSEMIAALDGHGVFDLGARLVLVGDGPSRPEIERVVAERGLNDRVQITGPMGRAEVLRQLAAMDVALQPAATEYASPMKLIEYLAAAKAVVAPDQENIRELVEDRRTALLFTPGDWAGFAARVRELVSSPDLRLRLGQAAKGSIAAQGRTWRANAARVAALINGRGTARPDVAVAAQPD